jgi:hypothetical protein
MIDLVVKRLLKIIGEGGTDCSYAKNEILEILHTLENQYGYEIPNMFDEFDKLEEE